MHSTYIAPNNNTLRSKVYRHLTNFLFSILPVRITNVYVTLLFIALVYSYRSKTLIDDKETLHKVETMLKLHIDDDLLVLPEQTCKWYWSDEILNTEIEDTAGNKYKLYQALADNHLFLMNRTKIIDTLMDNLPALVKFKLGYSNPINRIRFKHNIASTFLYA